MPWLTWLLQSLSKASDEALNPQIVHLPPTIHCPDKFSRPKAGVYLKELGICVSKDPDEINLDPVFDQCPGKPSTPHSHSGSPPDAEASCRVNKSLPIVQHDLRRSLASASYYYDVWLRDSTGHALDNDCDQGLPDKNGLCHGVSYSDSTAFCDVKKEEWYHISVDEQFCFFVQGFVPRKKTCPEGFEYKSQGLPKVRFCEKIIWTPVELQQVLNPASHLLYPVEAVNPWIAQSFANPDLVWNPGFVDPPESAPRHFPRRRLAPSSHRGPSSFGGPPVGLAEGSWLSNAGPQLFRSTGGGRASVATPTTQEVHGIRYPMSGPEGMPEHSTWSADLEFGPLLGSQETRYSTSSHEEDPYSTPWSLGVDIIEDTTQHTGDKKKKKEKKEKKKKKKGNDKKKDLIPRHPGLDLTPVDHVICPPGMKPMKKSGQMMCRNAIVIDAEFDYSCKDNYFWNPEIERCIQIRAVRSSKSCPDNFTALPEGGCFTTEPVEGLNPRCYDLDDPVNITRFVPYDPERRGEVIGHWYRLNVWDKLKGPPRCERFIASMPLMSCVNYGRGEGLEYLENQGTSTHCAVPIVEHPFSANWPSERDNIREKRLRKHLNAWQAVGGFLSVEEQRESVYEAFAQLPQRERLPSPDW